MYGSPSISVVEGMASGGVHNSVGNAVVVQTTWLYFGSGLPDAYWRNGGCPQCYNKLLLTSDLPQHLVKWHYLLLIGVNGNSLYPDGPGPAV